MDALSIAGQLVAIGGKQDAFPAGIVRPASGRYHRVDSSSLSPCSLPSSSSRTASRDCGVRLLVSPVLCSKGVTEGDSGGAASRNEAEERYPEDDLLALEAALQSAVKYENYMQAAIIRDKIRKLQEDEVASVLAANAMFYEAFAQGEMSLMKRVWLNADHIYCIHPGADCISGYELVIASWDLVLGPPLKFDLQNLQVHVKGAFGYVSCTEFVRSTGNSWGRQVATNIFEKRDGEWFMCVHHASHV